MSLYFALAGPGNLRHRCCIMTALSLSRGVASAALVLLAYSPARAWVPPTVSIQGRLEDAAGQPVSGNRVWFVRYYTDETGTTQVGPEYLGTTVLSDSGRFAFSLTLSPTVLAEPNLHYQLGIDGDSPPDGVDADDFLPGLVRVTSVPFALRAQSAETAANADVAEVALDSLLLGGASGDQYRASRTYQAVVGAAPSDFATIQEAIASGAKTIFVRNGTYSIFTPVTIPAAGFTMVGESRDGVVINLGSAGMLRFSGDTGLPYAVGTVAVGNSSTAVTAASGSPAWLANVAPGEVIRIGRTYHEVASVTSNTELVLRQRYQGPAQTGASYAVASLGTGFHFENLTFNNPPAAGALGAQEASFGAITLRYARDITIRNCRAAKTTSSSTSSCGPLAYLENCNNAIVAENRTRDTGLLTAASSSNITVADNEIAGGDSFGTSALAFVGVSNDEPLFANIIRGNRISGVRSGADRSAIYYGYLSTTGVAFRGDYIISDNIITNCVIEGTVTSAGGAIQLFNSFSGVGVISNNIISANNSNGIAMVGADFIGLSITGNVITGNSGFGISGSSTNGHASRLITANMMDGNLLGGVGTIGTANGTMNLPRFEVPVP